MWPSSEYFKNLIDSTDEEAKVGSGGKEKAKRKVTCNKINDFVFKILTFQLLLFYWPEREEKVMQKYFLNLSNFNSRS